MAENSTLWTWGNQQKYHTEIKEEVDKKLDDYNATAQGNPVTLNGLQEGVPFSEVTVSGDIIGKELKVTACGKNILRYPYTTADKTVCGVTYTDNGDGSITVSGTHSGETVSTDYFSFSPWGEGVTLSAYKPLFVPKGQTVTWMVHGLPDNFRFSISVSDFDGSTIDVARSNDRTPITYTTSRDCYIGCSIKPLETAYGQDISFTCYPQLEYGSTATAYEPYNGADYTITPDSNPYIVPTEIYQQDGINTVYVTSEGEPTLSVTGVKRNAAVRRIWDKLNELTTAIIVSNGEI